MRILVTGASGNVGQAVIQSLLQFNLPTLEIIATTSRPELQQADTGSKKFSWITFDFENPHNQSFAEYDRVFLLRPPQISDVKRYFAPLVDQMRQEGVKHVVFLSLQGAENNTITPHYKIEQLILQSGIPYTFLRPSFFMQNLSTTHRKEIAERGEIFIPAGNGRTNFVDVYDLGLVAAQVLTSELFYHKALELTGNEALTYQEIADILTRVLDKPIRYAKPSALTFLIRKLREGQPLSFVVVMIALYTVARMGKAAGQSPVMEQLLGRKPTSFETFAQREQAAWN